MKEELEKLSRLGVQKVYDDTHISAHHVQAILHGSFDGFSRVQFLGFISILEREYHVPLVVLKKTGLEYFKELDERSLDEGLLVMPTQKKSKTALYITFVVVFAAAILFVNYFLLDKSSEQDNTIDNTLIRDVQKNIIEAKQNVSIQNQALIVDINDTNETDQSNVKTVIESVELKKEANNSSILAESFTIVPRAKVWFGYIDVQTNKKRQKTLTDSMSLDANKSWLLLFGHGYIDMSINGVVQKFDSRNKKRFLYENGTLEAISSTQFRALNRGLKW